MAAIPPAQPGIKGLPEGVELVALDVAGPNDYELVGDQILKGVRAGAAASVIVRPAKGYSFIPSKGTFDIRTFALVPGPPNLYVVKKDDPRPATVIVKFLIGNQADGTTVLAALEKLKELPGFVSIEEI